MDGPRFSAGEAVKFGWETVTGNLKVFIVAALIVFAISIMPNVSDSWVVWVVSWILGMVVSLGLIKMSLRFVDGEQGELVDLFETFPLVLSYLVASIVVSIIVGIGVLLCIIPGLIIGVRVGFYGWIIVDKGLGPFEAIQESWEITKGSFWNLILVWLLMCGVNILGFLCLGVGLLITVPLSWVAFGYVYRRMEEAATG